MNAMRLCRLAFLSAVAAVFLSAEVVRIRVVDGRDGKTITNEHVQVWVVGKRVSRSLTPGTYGVAEFRAPAGSSVEIGSNLYFDWRPFEKGAPRPTYSIDEIETSGIVSLNTCGKSAAQAKPGELLFFVRPLPWWERVRRGIMR